METYSYADGMRTALRCTRAELEEDRIWHESKGFYKVETYIGNGRTAYSWEKQPEGQEKEK